MLHLRMPKLIRPWLAPYLMKVYRRGQAHPIEQAIYGADDPEQFADQKRAWSEQERFWYRVIDAITGKVLETTE